MVLIIKEISLNLNQKASSPPSDELHFDLDNSSINFALNFTDNTIKHLSCDIDPEGTWSQQTETACLPRLSGFVTAEAKTNNNDELCITVLNASNNPVVNYPVSWSFGCNLTNKKLCDSNVNFSEITFSDSKGKACLNRKIKTPRIASYVCDKSYQDCSNKEFSAYNIIATLDGQQEFLFN